MPVADHVPSLSYRIDPSNLDLLGDLYCAIELDTEKSNGAFDLQLPAARTISQMPPNQS
jgi:hypothetical protein